LVIQENISLKKHNTFGIDVTAKRFVSVNTIHELKEVLEEEKDIFILSGGSNMLLTKDIEKLVVHINLKGISMKQDWDTVDVTVSAGEDWHQFVLWCLNLNFGGLENLSLIPGNVGTSPIQNIGAYGVEVKDLITEVKGVDIATGELKTFSNEDCQFGYRNSIFKNELKGKIILTSVTFRLTTNQHKINTSYGAIEAELAAHNIKKPTIQQVAAAVIKIRQSKLPDPKQIGNSGSFFKNPVIAVSHFEKLKTEYPNIPSYPISDSEIKVPAGWLIEQAGFKGNRFGEYGVHEKQALVLVNYGNASGADIYALAQKIQQTISDQFGISLEIEVNVI
jgi:UDP-N-acetylmuramate dehydrogenase